MNVLLRRACVALVALVAFAQAPAASLTRAGDLQPGTRPANVPADYLVTPAGYFHAACVVELDEQVLASGDVRRHDGSLRRIAACTHPSFGRHGERREPDGTRTSLADATAFDGWLAYNYSDAARPRPPRAWKPTFNGTAVDCDYNVTTTADQTHITFASH